MILIQVVCYDSKNFIRQYRDFNLNIEGMTELEKYVSMMITDMNVTKVELKRWPE